MTPIPSGHIHSTYQLFTGSCRFSHSLIMVYTCRDEICCTHDACQAGSWSTDELDNSNGKLIQEAQLPQR